MKENIQGWTESVNILAGVAPKHPQSAYSGPQNSLQHEWAFVQRVTPGVRDSFDPLEDALKETFVPLYSSQGPSRKGQEGPVLPV